MSDSHQRFGTTRWSMVVAARDKSSTTAKKALAELCQTYWPPLYAFARHSGHQAADAQDLTQAFFTSLLNNRLLDSAESQRGRFRSYLLTAFTRFATSQSRRETAQKRGGNIQTLSLDFERLEAETLQNVDSPDVIFQRRWAMTVLQQVVTLLEEEYASKGKQSLFDQLKNLLVPGESPASYEAIAQTLQTTEGAIKVAAHRLKQRYRQLLRAQIAETVASSADIDSEIQELMNSFQKSP